MAKRVSNVVASRGLQAGTAFGPQSSRPNNAGMSHSSRTTNAGMSMRGGGKTSGGRRMTRRSSDVSSGQTTNTMKDTFQMPESGETEEEHQHLAWIRTYYDTLNMQLDLLQRISFGALTTSKTCMQSQLETQTKAQLEYDEQRNVLEEEERKLQEERAEAERGTKQESDRRLQMMGDSAEREGDGGSGVLGSKASWMPSTFKVTAPSSANEASQFADTLGAPKIDTTMFTTLQGKRENLTEEQKEIEKITGWELFNACISQARIDNISPTATWKCLGITPELSWGISITTLKRDYVFPTGGFAGFGGRGSVGGADPTSPLSPFGAAAVPNKNPHLFVPRNSSIMANTTLVRTKTSHGTRIHNKKLTSVAVMMANANLLGFSGQFASKTLQAPGIRADDNMNLNTGANTGGATHKSMVTMASTAHATSATNHMGNTNVSSGMGMSAIGASTNVSGTGASNVCDKTKSNASNMGFSAMSDIEGGSGMGRSTAMGTGMGGYYGAGRQSEIVSPFGAAGPIRRNSVGGGISGGALAAQPGGGLVLGRTLGVRNADISRSRMDSLQNCEIQCQLYNGMVDELIDSVDRIHRDHMSWTECAGTSACQIPLVPFWSGKTTLNTSNFYDGVGNVKDEGDFVPKYPMAYGVGYDGESSGGDGIEGAGGNVEGSGGTDGGLHDASGGHPQQKKYLTKIDHGGKQRTRASILAPKNTAFERDSLVQANGGQGKPTGGADVINPNSPPRAGGEEQRQKVGGTGGGLQERSVSYFSAALNAVNLAPNTLGWERSVTGFLYGNEALQTPCLPLIIGRKQEREIALALGENPDNNETVERPLSCLSTLKESLDRLIGDCPALIRAGYVEGLHVPFNMQGGHPTSGLLNPNPHHALSGHSPGAPHSVYGNPGLGVSIPHGGAFGATGVLANAGGLATTGGHTVTGGIGTALVVGGVGTTLGMQNLGYSTPGYTNHHPGGGYHGGGHADAGGGYGGVGMKMGGHHAGGTPLTGRESGSESEDGYGKESEDSFLSWNSEDAKMFASAPSVMDGALAKKEARKEKFRGQPLNYPAFFPSLILKNLALFSIIHLRNRYNTAFTRHLRESTWLQTERVKTNLKISHIQMHIADLEKPLKEKRKVQIQERDFLTEMLELEIGTLEEKVHELESLREEVRHKVGEIQYLEHCLLVRWALVPLDHGGAGRNSQYDTKGSIMPGGMPGAGEPSSIVTGESSSIISPLPDVKKEQSKKKVYAVDHKETEILLLRRKNLLELLEDKRRERAREIAERDRVLNQHIHEEEKFYQRKEKKSIPFGTMGRPTSFVGRESAFGPGGPPSPKMSQSPKSQLSKSEGLKEKASSSGLRNSTSKSGTTDISRKASPLASSSLRTNMGNAGIGLEVSQGIAHHSDNSAGAGIPIISPGSSSGPPPSAFGLGSPSSLVSTPGGSPVSGVSRTPPIVASDQGQSLSTTHASSRQLRGDSYVKKTKSGQPPSNLKTDSKLVAQ